MKKFSQIQQNYQISDDLLPKDDTFEEKWLSSDDQYVIFMPYLIDQNCVLLLESNVSAYNAMKIKERNYLVSAKIKMDKNETPEDSLLRGMEYELGLNTKTVKDYDIEGPFYIFPTSNNKVYYCVPFLYQSEYAHKEKNNVSKISLRSLKNLNPSDLITKMLIYELRLKLNII